MVLRRRLNRERGATAVEFALILPLVLGLVGLIITVAMGMAARGLLHRATEAGARAAAVIADPADRTSARYLDCAGVEDAVREAALLLDPDAITVCPIEWHDGHQGEGAAFTVTATYTWSNPAVRLLAPVMSPGSADPMTMVTQARRIRE